MKKTIIFFITLVLLTARSKADEGMWLPLLIEKLNFGKMTELGLKLSADDIYSINKASLKDALVMLDYGSCTGEMVSKDGLMFTNHHCGYGEIQAHSSVEHDYLTNGFWALRNEDELPNPNKTASFLIRIEDVTERINSQLDNSMDEKSRLDKISFVSTQIQNEAIEGTNYEASVESMFSDNYFYLFVYETFKDVRLVGAPPESIGKFGADTDNWMWPRHTADFSMFRVYSGPDGKPAEYSEKNVPYHPKHFLPVSLDGYKNGDFAMIMGFPGSTNRYLTSWGVIELLELTNPNRIKIRGMKQKIWDQQMQTSDKIRIQYSSKYAISSNYWKYSIGQSKGLKRLKVMDTRSALEKQLTEWISQNPERKEKYGVALGLIEEAYRLRKPYKNASQYLYETLLGGTELFKFAQSFKDLVTLLKDTKPGEAGYSEGILVFKKSALEFYKDYDANTDKMVMAAMLKLYDTDVPVEFHPKFLSKARKKFKGDFNLYAADLFKKTIFADSSRLFSFLTNPTARGIEKDPAYAAMLTINSELWELKSQLDEIKLKLTRGERLFQAALMEMQSDRVFYPNANSTMRLTYGTVCDYYPGDAVHYNYFTTLKGVIEKEDPNNREFNVPLKLKELYQNKDYAPYSKDSIFQTCFLTNNDITGGNSGSPVINAKGQLIGLAFDGNWEAMAGDIIFEPALQRCINADIRYILLVIDKIGGAKNLIDEMTLIRENP